MYQKVTLVGNLGRDPEMKYVPSGDAVTNLSVATNRTWNDKNGQKKQETTWFNVSVWGSQAEACNTYLSKGSQVLVEGTLQPGEGGNPRTYKRDNGECGSSFDVRAFSVKFLQGGEAGQESSPSTGPSNEPSSWEDEDDEIPF